MTAAGRVMIVGHDASRTGAPHLLLSSLRWARSNTSAELSLVLDRGGPLVDSYRSILPVHVLDAPVHRLRRRSVSAVGAASRLGAAVDGIDRAMLTSRRRSARSDVVLANTLAALPTSLALAGRASRLVVHVHELDHVAERILPRDPARRRAQLDRVDRFVATGWPVAHMLERRLGVAGDRIRVVDAFVDPHPTDEVEVARVRHALRGDDRSSLVVSIGASSHRKGTDRFVDLMECVADHPSRPRGIWLGGDPDGTVAAEMRRDAARAGLVDRVEVLGQRDDVAPILAAADVVVSTAREDPFPLGLLEAAMVATPVVAFDSGGAGDVLRASGNEDCVVPIGDTIAMASRISDLLGSAADARRSAQLLADHVRSHHVTEVLAPALWAAVLDDGDPGRPT